MAATPFADRSRRGALQSRPLTSRAPVRLTQPNPPPLQIYLYFQDTAATGRVTACARDLLSICPISLASSHDATAFFADRSRRGALQSRPLTSRAPVRLTYPRARTLAPPPPIVSTRNRRQDDNLEKPNANTRYASDRTPPRPRVPTRK